MPIINIQTHTCHDVGAGGSKLLQVQVWPGDKPKARQIITLDVQTFNKDEVRRYLEEYAEKSPRSTTRANKAVDIITSFGQYLATAIPWNKMITTTRLEEGLVLQIYPSIRPDPEESVMWEILEQTNLWPSSIEPSSVTVVRLIRQVQSVEDKSMVSGKEKTLATRKVTQVDDPFIVSKYARFSMIDSECPIRVLVVSARPNFKDDIPHRLVSKIISYVITNVPPESRHLMCMEVVRPGTFQSLQQHLESKGRGFFQIVHLDVHGMEDKSGGLCLAFIASPRNANPTSIEVDLVSAERLGSLLHDFGVACAVLNVCRSAQMDAPNRSMAEIIAAKGVPVVLAMAFNVIASCVEIFTRNFYEAMLRHRLPPEISASHARKCLLHFQKRMSGIGRPVLVLDYTVPRISTSGIPVTQALMYQHLCSQLEMYEDTLDHDIEGPLGREDDILGLETTALTVKKPMLITGDAGIGKTELLRFLKFWWMKTSLIENIVDIQLSSTGHFSLAKLYNRVTKIMVDEDQNDQAENLDSSCLAYIQTHRLLIIIDSLDFMKDQPDHPKRQQRTEIRKFLSKVQSGKSIVLLASRLQESWLARETVGFELSGLGLLSGLKFLCSPQGGSGSTEEDTRYLELLIKMTGGNPLALKLLIQNSRYYHLSSKELYFHLLLAQPLALDPSMLPGESDAEGHRSLRELLEIMGQIAHSPSDCYIAMPFAPFWSVIPLAELPVCQAFFNSRLTRMHCGDDIKERTERELNFLTVLDILGGLPPELEELLEKARNPDLANESSSNYNGTESFMEIAFITDMEDILNLPEFQMSIKLASARCDAFTEPLKSMGFITDIPSYFPPEELRKRRYKKLNPLVPIMIRSQAYWSMDTDGVATASKRAFILFQAYTARKWPCHIPYWNDLWKPARFDSNIAFTNYASAAILYNGLDMVDFILQIKVWCMLSFLNRAILADPSRVIVIQVILERSLAFLLEMEENIQTQISQATTLESPSPLDCPLPIKLLLVRVFAFSVAGHLHIRYQHTYNPLAGSIFESMKSLSRKLQATPLPPEVHEVEFLRRVWDIREKASPDSSDVDRAGQFMDWMVEHFGTGGNDQFLTRAGRIPFLPGLAVVHKFLPHKEAYNDAMAAEDYDKALEILDQAWLEETNQRSNDSMNKINLLIMRSDVQDKQEEWGDALRSFREAKALRAASGEEMDIFNVEYEKGLMAKCEEKSA